MSRSPSLPFGLHSSKLLSNSGYKYWLTESPRSLIETVGRRQSLLVGAIMEAVRSIRTAVGPPYFSLTMIYLGMLPDRWIGGTLYPRP